MPRKPPPLNAIRAFEASARHGGFVAAANELGVTPAAISLQIRKLEDHYEVALFRRLASGVELTEVGAAIHAECAAALSTLEAMSDLVTGRETRRESSSVASTRLRIAGWRADWRASGKPCRITGSIFAPRRIRWTSRTAAWTSGSPTESTSTRIMMPSPCSPTC